MCVAPDSNISQCEYEHIWVLRGVPDDPHISLKHRNVGQEEKKDCSEIRSLLDTYSAVSVYTVDESGSVSVKHTGFVKLL